MDGPSVDPVRGPRPEARPKPGLRHPDFPHVPFQQDRVPGKDIFTGEPCDTEVIFAVSY